MKDRALFKTFGLDPTRIYFDNRLAQAAADIRRGVASRKLMAIVGAFGSGKSVLWRVALATQDRVLNNEYPRVVFVPQPDKERLRIGGVMASIIHDLSEESPKASLIARTYQVSRIVGEAVVRNRKEVCIVIENAHRMHANTLLALKDLMESIRYGATGESNLFSILLVGQEPLRGKLERFGEVRYRAKIWPLPSMTLASRMEYLLTIYGDVIDEAMRKEIAILFHTPLQMDAFIEGRLELMNRAGVLALTKDRFPISIEEQMEALQASTSKIAQLAQLTPVRVFQALADPGKRADRGKIQAALDELANPRESIRAA